MFENIVENVRNKTPLIHNITNYVTVNDVANILLACGGSPIMAEDINEAEDITSICGGTNINIGTLNINTIESMIKAGKKANKLSHFTILDPVGAGASKFRTKMTFRLLKEVDFSVIRGNISEIKTISFGGGITQGVDADINDAVTEDNLSEAVTFAKNLSKKLRSIIAITGAIDIVSDADTSYIIRNGHTIMSKITGTGCMLDAVIAAYCVANPEDILKATAAAVCAEGICGEDAYEKTILEKSGTGSFRTYLIDYMSIINDDILERRGKIEVR